jgi:hypothetical protein
MTITDTAGVGGRRMLRLARDWTGAEVLAAALMRRADVVVTSERSADLALPQDMLLALDAHGTLHLVRMGGLVLARPRETLRRWPAGTATVTVRDGRGWFRPLTITDSRDTVTLAAPYMEPRQKSALALLERLTA